MRPTPEEIEKMWPCTCTRTTFRGKRQFRLNSPQMKRCGVCRTTKAEVDAMKVDSKTLRVTK